MDTRFDPVRIIATDRLNNRVVHLGLDRELLGVVNDELLLPPRLRSTATTSSFSTFGRVHKFDRR